MRNCMRLSIVPFVITRVSAMAKTTPTHVTSYLVTRRAVDYKTIDTKPIQLIIGPANGHGMLFRPQIDPNLTPQRPDPPDPSGVSGAAKEGGTSHTLKQVVLGQIKELEAQLWTQGR